MQGCAGTNPNLELQMAQLLERVRARPRGGGLGKRRRPVAARTLRATPTHGVQTDGAWVAGCPSMCASSTCALAAPQVLVPAYGSMVATFMDYLNASRPALVMCDFMLDACTDVAFTLKLPFIVAMATLMPGGVPVWGVAAPAWR